MTERQPMLHDGDLRLRPVKLLGDVSVAIPWYEEPEVLRYSEGEGTSPYDAAQVEHMYRMMMTCCELYMIEVETPTGWRAIGDAALRRKAGLPIIIGEAAYRSHGLGGRVLRLLLDRARALGLPRLVVQGVFTYNERARRLYERAGFRVVGEVADGEGRPMWRMGLPL